MGLCKCPRKKVTNLFCFEHRVNVCEHCTIDDHPNCIVQSYLMWLQDSDYDPNCQLCGESLNANTSQTVRLLCLHLFHWSCLDKWAQHLPPNTAPAGYRCPMCKEPVFPQSNQASPLAAALKAKLQHVGWAKSGLGLSFAQATIQANDNDETIEGMMDTSVSLPDSESAAINVRKPNFLTADSSDINNFMKNLQRQEPKNDTDNSDVKYKRRPAFEWLGRWLKSKRMSIPKRTIRPWSCRRIFFYTLLIVISLMTLVTILSRLGRSHFGALDNDDPLFDPAANPNIRQAGPDPAY